MMLTEEGKVLVSTALKLKEISDEFPAESFCLHACEDCLFNVTIAGVYDKKCLIAIIDNWVEAVKE